jgi:hypothetical protein
MDALYFRVSSDRQTTANQFVDLIDAAARDDSGRDWSRIREALAVAIYEEDRPARAGSTRTVYRIRPEVAADLAHQCIYIEQGRSSKAGAARRPMFGQRNGLLNQLRAKLKRSGFTDYFEGGDPDPSCPLWKYIRLEEFHGELGFDLDSFVVAIVDSFRGLIEIEPLIEDAFRSLPVPPRPRPSERHLNPHFSQVLGKRPSFMA